MSQSTQTVCKRQAQEQAFVKRPRKPKTKRLAVVGFMTRNVNTVESRDLDRLLSQAEDRGFDFEYFPAMPVGTGWGERVDWADPDFYRDKAGALVGPHEYQGLVVWLKILGYREVLVLAERKSDALRIFLGQLHEAGMRVTLLSVGRGVITAKPGTRRWERNEETGESEPTEVVWGIPGEWQSIPGTLAAVWKPQRWSYRELAETVFTTKTKATMWRPSDYATMETLADREVYCLEDGVPKEMIGTETYVPLRPPEGVEYPHDLQIEDMLFCEIPLRTLDWLAGQPWLFGELRARLLQYHASRPVQAALEKRYRTEDEKYQDTKDDCSLAGYFEGNEFVSTGTYENGGRDFWYGKVRWLTAKDRFGRRIKDNATEGTVETPLFRLKKKAEGQQEWVEYLDPRPSRWEGDVTPWGFDNVADEDEAEVDEENLLADELEEDWEYYQDLARGMRAEEVKEEATREYWLLAGRVAEGRAKDEGEARRRMRRYLWQKAHAEEMRTYDGAWQQVQEAKQPRCIEVEALLPKWRGILKRTLARWRARGKAINEELREAGGKKAADLAKELLALRKAYRRLQREDEAEAFAWKHARAEAERNAWYEGLAVLDQLTQLRDWMAEGMVVRRAAGYAKEAGRTEEQREADPAYAEYVTYDLHDEAAWQEYNARLARIRERVTPGLAAWIRKPQKRATKEWVYDAGTGRKEWRVREEAEESLLGQLRRVRGEIDVVWEENQMRRKLPQASERADAVAAAAGLGVEILEKHYPGSLRLAAWFHEEGWEQLPEEYQKYRMIQSHEAMLEELRQAPWLERLRQPAAAV